MQGMADKREGEKNEEDKRGGEERKGEAGQSMDEERVAFGPLEIKRHLEDDGRTLILYTLRVRAGGEDMSEDT
jgi:hypothetical protein